jgi:hypothetical protein
VQRAAGLEKVWGEPFLRQLWYVLLRTLSFKSVIRIEGRTIHNAPRLSENGCVRGSVEAMFMICLSLCLWSACQETKHIQRWMNMLVRSDVDTCLALQHHAIPIINFFFCCVTFVWWLEFYKSVQWRSNGWVVPMQSQRWVNWFMISCVPFGQGSTQSENPEIYDRWRLKCNDPL